MEGEGEEQSKESLFASDVHINKADLPAAINIALNTASFSYVQDASAIVLRSLLGDTSCSRKRDRNFEVDVSMHQESQMMTVQFLHFTPSNVKFSQYKRQQHCFRTRKTGAS